VSFVDINTKNFGFFKAVGKIMSANALGILEAPGGNIKKIS
jgi:hypothetical protein